MPKQGLMIAGAAAVSLLVLVATLLLGPQTQREQPQDDRAAGEIDPADVPELDGDFDPAQALQEGQAFDGTQILQDATGGVYRYVEQDRETLLFYDRVHPQGTGVLEVTQPVARVYFAPGRVMQVEADRCVFVAPENQPQSGEFEGNVRVTLFEAAGEPVDFESYRHVQLRAELDEAEFDLEMNEVHSTSDVVIRSRQVDFAGRGLSFTYNELRGRLEYLEVFEGEELRVRPRDAARDEAEPVDDPVAARDEPPQEPDAEPSPAPREPAEDARAEQDRDEASAAEQPPEPTFYRGRFSENVRVDANRGEATIAGDRMDILFSLEAGAGRDLLTRRGTAGDGGLHRPAAGRGPGPAAMASADAGVAPLDVESEGDDGSGDELREVVVRWDGPLVVEPDAAAGDRLADVDDALLMVYGSPARLRTAAGQAIDAGRLAYQTSDGQMQAAAGEMGGVTLRDPAMGTLEGVSVTINAAAGRGHVIGPGRLRTDAARLGEANAELDTSSDTSDELTIAWEDRLNLAFYVNDEAASDDEAAVNPAERLTGLREATFIGQVRVQHAMFELGSNRLSFALDEPGAGGGGDETPGLRRIDAADSVQLSVTGEQVDDQLELSSDELAITLDRDRDGRTHPSHFAAAGLVRIDRHDMRMEGGTLDVALRPHEPGEDASDSPGRVGDELVIEQAVAERDVLLVIVEEQVRFEGERLHAEPARERLELFAGPDAHARVTRPDSVLTGAHIVFSQPEQAVQVHGAGRLQHVMDADRPGERMDVAWTDAMYFSDVEQWIELAGEVETRTHGQDSRTRLRADEVQMQLAPAPGEPVEGDEDRLIGRRQVREAEARGEVAFEAESVNDRGQVDARFRLEGPEMAFDSEGERLQVLGAGWMGIENRRQREPEQDEPEADDVATPVRVTGRGDTVFTWTGGLTLEASENNVIFDRDVQMVHQPEDEREPMQLDAQWLLADFEQTGGLASWTEGAAASPEIDLIRAREAVRILHENRTVLTDHLQYTASDQTVLLWADEGNEVRISEAGRPTPMRAGQIRWDLSHDRFDITDIGPSIIPVPE